MNKRLSANLVLLGLGACVWGISACDDGVSFDEARLSTSDDELTCDPAQPVPHGGLTGLQPKTLQLWPPNHKFHSIGVEDCVSLAGSCDLGLVAEFTWASSDEPIDDLGDGHHAPDILFDSCQRVQVRAERQGPKDGRVYKLGVRLVDRAGHVSEAACSIVVDHDQRGVIGSDSGEKYRVELNGQNGLPSCDGQPEPVPPTPVPDASVPAPDASTVVAIGI